MGRREAKINKYGKYFTYNRSLHSCDGRVTFVCYTLANMLPVSFFKQIFVIQLFSLSRVIVYLLSTYNVIYSLNYQDGCNKSGI